ncbi:MAG: dolichol-phosphate mannosyltransferase [Microgenomates group bacterium Gr01-1014_7]|nr:MAG: dolichol-phosphate mannosyltransferase [Microgenomates group bacterium Gr01-1014_7]
MKKRSEHPFVSVMIAALNEEKNIERTIRETIKIKKYKLEVLVVLDSKTTDHTGEVAKKAGAKVIHTGKWLGKGAALRLALPSAKGDIIVQMDADYQFMPYDIPKLVEPLLSGYDVALGSRYEKGGNPEKGSVTRLRRIGIYALSLLTSCFSGQRITDMPAGFKAFKKKALEDINMQINHYGYEAEVIIKAAQKNYKIICVPIDYKTRVVGNSKLIPFKDGFLFLKTILSVGFRGL